VSGSTLPRAPQPRDPDAQEQGQEGEPLPLHYKVVETSSVTDEDLEKILNEWTAKGWVLDGIRFAMRESSKRPSMAFVTFTRQDAQDEAT
jgi:hypothetical protein